MTDENQTIGAGNLPPSDQAVVDTAIAAINALNNDPNYCANVGVSGSAVNTAVHDFKSAYNAAYGPTPGSDTGQPLPHNGQYDQATADALNSEQTGLTPPAACAAQPPSPPPTPPQPPPGPIVPSGGLPTWAKWLLGLVAAAAVVFAGVMIYRGSKKKGSHSAGEAPRRRRRKRRKARRKSKRR